MKFRDFYAAIAGNSSSGDVLVFTDKTAPGQFRTDSGRTYEAVPYVGGCGF